MTQQTRILVTGATGNLGRAVSAPTGKRRRRGARVGSQPRYPADMPEEVEAARGDLSKPDTLEEALSGVGAVFLVSPFLYTVEETTGHPARTFREWASDHAGDFGRREREKVEETR